MKFLLSHFLVLVVAAVSLIPQASAQVVEIPDPNLEKAIRKELNLPDEIPITQQEMLGLNSLYASNSNITDLTGLEHATYLYGFLGSDNHIHNLEPLAGLIRLETLALNANQISDLSPLANLTNLTGMDLGWNNISDVTPLANLTKLESLSLNNNSIEDISPLTNLTNLWLLHIQFNFIADITPLQGLNLTDFEYDEACDIEPFLPSVRERIENRSFPSTFRLGVQQLRTERPD